MGLEVLLLIESARTWMAGRGTRAGVAGGVQRENVGRCQLVCGACVCVSVHACKGRPGMVVRSMDMVPNCLGLKPSCVALDRSLDLSVLWFPPLKNGHSNNAQLTEQW